MSVRHFPSVRHFLILLPLLTVAAPALAQINSDGSLGTTINGNPNFVIQGGSPSGVNLFHSFENFSIPKGGSATFDLAPNPGIRNVIGRVTGATASDIDGTIRILNANNSVNLFLLNTNGFIFRANAQLNISGSFIAATAPTLVFADGTQFDTTLPNPATLTISAPNRFLLPTNGAGITIEAETNLSAGNNGQNLALFANQITNLGGTVQAPTGIIQITDLDDTEDILLAFPVPSGNIVPTPTPTPIPSPTPIPTAIPAPIPAPLPIPIPGPIPPPSSIPTPTPIPGPTVPPPEPTDGNMMLPLLEESSQMRRWQSKTEMEQLEGAITLLQTSSNLFDTRFTCPNISDSQFVITGRSGIPENPVRRLFAHRTWVDLRVMPTDLRTAAPANAPAHDRQQPEPDLIEAAGWYRNAQGQIELAAADHLSALQVNVLEAPQVNCLR